MLGLLSCARRSRQHQCCAAAAAAAVCVCRGAEECAEAGVCAAPVRPPVWCAAAWRGGCGSAGGLAPHTSSVWAPQRDCHEVCYCVVSDVVVGDMTSLGQDWFFVQDTQRQLQIIMASYSKVHNRNYLVRCQEHMHLLCTSLRASKHTHMLTCLRCTPCNHHVPTHQVLPLLQVPGRHGAL